MATTRYVAWENTKYRVVGDTANSRFSSVEKLAGVDAMGAARWVDADVEGIIDEEAHIAVAKAVIELSNLVKMKQEMLQAALRPSGPPAS